MEDRRKYVRIHEEAKISYSVIPSTKVEQYLTSNISQGGVRFFVHSFIPEKSFLRVRITFSKAIVTIEAVVELVWISEVPYGGGKYEVGAKFMDISQEAADHLVSYIRSFASMKPDINFDSM